MTSGVGHSVLLQGSVLPVRAGSISRLPPEVFQVRNKILTPAEVHVEHDMVPVPACIPLSCGSP